MPKEKVILPQKYYLDYFSYLLDFVERHYAHVLDLPEYQFLQSFRSLSEEAQCLYVRLSNRNGDYFRLSKIVYEEITQPEAAKDELLQHEFITINESADTIQFNLFTKAELISYYDFLDRHSKKSEIVAMLTEVELASVHAEEEIAQVLKNQEVDFIKLLFFGNRYGQMTEFVIRDVGNVRIQALDESQFKPWFDSRADALGVMHVSQLKKVIREMMAEDIPLLGLLEEVPWKEWLLLPRTKTVTHKLLLEVAYHLERNGDLTEALNCYQLAEKPPSRERQIRILNKQNENEQAIRIAEGIVANPLNASELTFAKDFLEKSGIRINRSMTKRLRTAASVALHPSNDKVEQQVLSYFVEKGWSGAHTENFIWRSLFGLVFWGELFDEQHGAFHHPLQRQPSDLNDMSFFETRESALRKRLDKLKTKKQLLKHVEQLASRKKGIANQFVHWHSELLSFLEILILRLPLGGLKKVLLEISKNTKENSTGFPDLFLWKADDYQFYEVKSPNDHLSAQQLFWLNFFNSVKIKAEIMRIQYQTEDEDA